MGLFNEVTGPAVCPGCSNTVVVRAQFKYGHTRQLKYGLGEQLQWGGDYERHPPRRANDIGVPGKRSVVVDAIGFCCSCGHGSGAEEWSLYLYIQADRLVRLETADGSHDFRKTGETHIVLEH